MTKTLLFILLFVTFMVGSFIWFVATWDKTKEQPVSDFTKGTANDPIA